MIAETGFSQPWNGTISHVKCWDAVLTDAEIEREFNRGLPFRTTNLHFWWPMCRSNVTACAIDFSGNGRNATVTGTLAVEDGPPLTRGPLRNSSAPPLRNFNSWDRLVYEIQTRPRRLLTQILAPDVLADLIDHRPNRLDGVA